MARTVDRVVGVLELELELVESVASGVELVFCTNLAAPVAPATSAADSPASIAPTITPTPPRGILVALYPVATSRELVVTWVADIDALGCKLQASPFGMSRLRRFREGPAH